MATYQGTHCTCHGFSITEAQVTDRLCGSAKTTIKAVVDKLLSVSVDHCPGEVAVALKRHFKIDLAQTRGVWRVHRDIDLRNIRKVYEQVSADLKAGMHYERDSKANTMCWGNAAWVPRLNPKRVHVCPSFFQIPSSGGGQLWALLHEQIHFASRRPGALNAVGDRGYYETKTLIPPTKAYSELSSRQALRNADSYIWFARELVDPGFYWPH